MIPSPFGVCTRPGCENLLTRSQGKYCSHACRNRVLSPGNKGGAPTKYRPEFAKQKLDEYASLCEKRNEPTLVPTKSSYIVIKRAHLPSQEGYADFIGVKARTLRNWGDTHLDFAEALDRLHSIQLQFLINYGLASYYSTGITMLLLAVNHGLFIKRESSIESKALDIVKKFYERVDELEKEKYGLGQ